MSNSIANSMKVALSHYGFKVRRDDSPDELFDLDPAKAGEVTRMINLQTDLDGLPESVVVNFKDNDYSMTVYDYAMNPVYVTMFGPCQHWVRS